MEVGVYLLSYGGEGGGMEKRRAGPENLYVLQ